MTSPEPHHEPIDEPSDESSHERDANRASDRLLLTTADQAGGWIWTLAGGKVLTALAALLLPLWLGRAVDAFAAGRPPTGPVGVCTALIALIVLGEVLGDLADGSSSARSTAWLRKKLTGHLLTTGPRAGATFEAGNLVSRIVGNAAEAGRGGVAAVLALTALLPAVGGVVALLLIDPWLALTFLLGLLAMVVLLRTFLRDNSETLHRYQHSQGDIASRLLDALAGSRTIAAAGTAAREAERVLEPLGELRAHGKRMWHNQIRAAGHAELVLPLVQVLVIAVAGFELVSGRLSPGELFATSRYAAMGAEITGVVGMLNKVARARGGARRCRDLLTVPPVEHGERDLPPGLGRLEFRSATVREHDRVLLDNLDLTVPAGRTLAVVGHSGAGKSTLAALAGRLRDPDGGAVLLDRTPLTALHRDALRSEISYAFERPVLVGGTVAEALDLGRSLPRPALEDAAAGAAADDFVRRLPNGYDSALDTHALSGGEVQRLGLARSFARSGRLLVMDDATSSLDTATELRVSSVLTERLSGATALIVAHRVTTAARADLVAWLDRGRLRALGTHAQLWSDPDYRAVFGAGNRTTTSEEPLPAGAGS